VELHCIYLWGKFYKTGMYSFKRQIVWNWNVLVWEGANYV
jgi:hypothetical protein